jgi:FkbM family methyltransferase
MDVIGAVIYRTRSRAPRLGARLAWMREIRRGDPSLLVVETLVQPGDIVVDIGANWGFYTAAFTRLAGARGHVHVFEPNPAHTANLQAIRGGRPSMTIYPVALSDHAGTMDLHIPLAEGRPIDAWARLEVGSGTTLAHERVTVRVARLEAILPESTDVAFIKCDVEGHELPVLRGAEAILRHSHPSLLIEIEQRHQDSDIRITFEYLVRLGYAGYAIFPSGIRPISEFDVTRDQLALLGPDAAPYTMPPPGYVHDFLFVRPELDVARLIPSG